VMFASLAEQTGVNAIKTNTSADRNFNAINRLLINKNDANVTICNNQSNHRAGLLCHSDMLL